MSEVERVAADPRDRLGAAVRALCDVTARAGADADVIDGLAAEVEELTARLAGEPRKRYGPSGPFHRMSLVGGTAHPVAPQLEVTRTDSGVHAVTTLGPMYEGAPGLVHGGVVSLIFDHLMGEALFVIGQHAMTVGLEIRYRKPTPLGEPLTFTVGLDRAEGRKLHVVGEVRAAGVVTARATGVFLELTAANVAQLFTGRRTAGH